MECWHCTHPGRWRALVALDLLLLALFLAWQSPLVIAVTEVMARG